MKSLVLTLILAAVVQAAPAVPLERATCTAISQRKAWHTLTRDEKLAYVEAEKCLMSTPAKLGLKGAKTRFDEFQKLHILNTEVVHGVGAFFPFHRYLMHVHETILKTECNYTGIQPYWQETIDAGNFTHSVVLDPETGFGGDGAGPNNCIKDGPFKDYKNSLGPFQQIGDHCIDRKIDECMSAMAKQENVDLCMVAKNFSTAWPCFEGTVHGAGHGGIGAQMLNLYSSPGDPLFYLHHTYLDKLWWQWQEKDRSARLSDITGTNVGGSFFGGFPGNGSFPGFPTNGTFPGFPGNGTFPGFPPNGTFPGFPGNGTGNGTCFEFPGFPTPPHATEEQIAAAEGMPGDPGTTTTLGHVLTVYGMLPNITIADVMDTKGGYLCYEYI